MMQPSQLPEVRLSSTMQRELHLQQMHMRLIEQLTQQALDEQSQIFLYTMRKTFLTIQEITVLKQTYLGKRSAPEVEAWIDRMTRVLLAEIEKIPQDACRRILHGLQGAAVEPEALGFLDELRLLFTRRLSV